MLNKAVKDFKKLGYTCDISCEGLIFQKKAGNATVQITIDKEAKSFSKVKITASGKSIKAVDITMAEFEALGFLNDYFKDDVASAKELAEALGYKYDFLFDNTVEISNDSFNLRIDNDKHKIVVDEAQDDCLNEVSAALLAVILKQIEEFGGWEELDWRCWYE